MLLHIITAYMVINNATEQFIRNLPKRIEYTFDADSDRYIPTHLQKKKPKKKSRKKPTKNHRSRHIVVKFFCKLFA